MLFDNYDTEMLRRRNPVLYFKNLGNHIQLHLDVQWKLSKGQSIKSSLLDKKKNFYKTISFINNFNYIFISEEYRIIVLKQDLKVIQEHFYQTEIRFI